MVEGCFGGNWGNSNKSPFRQAYRANLTGVILSMSSKRETTQKVDPYKVCFFNGTLYLIGWCHVHDEVRMFVLDRIRLLHVTKERFIPPDDFDLDEYMKDSFGVIHTDVKNLRV